MNSIELLAPAGNMECFQAALLAGADAIYFGVGHHNARASATNFTMEEAKRAIDLAHILGARTYITLNTLVLDREMEEILTLASNLSTAGADAILVQDIGLLRELKKNTTIPLHASTQMSVHNAAGVLAAQKLGLSRAVLARELTLDEIMQIQSVAEIELEVFVHGAMCVSVSGQCLHSSLIGGRSGNRGSCAQPCRLKYQIDDGKPQNWLSMKDLCQLDSVPALKEIGVSSLKIEGRMKPIPYIVETVKAYRRAIDQGDKMREQDKERLKQVFNRGGFTSGYSLQEPLVDIEYNGHRGVRVGRIEQNQIVLEKSVQAGDVIALSLAEKGAEWHVKTDMQEGKHPLTIKNAPKSAVLWRLKSSRIEREAQEFAHRSTRKRMIDLTCNVVLDQPVQLRLSTIDGIAVCVEGEQVQRAKNAGLTETKIAASLEKFGDTPFQVHAMTIELNDERLFLPNSALNALRRDGAAALGKSIAQKFYRENQNAVLEQISRVKEEAKQPKLIAQCSTLDQALAAWEAGATDIYAQPRLWKTDILSAWADFAKEKSCCLHFPPILQGTAPERVASILDEVDAANFSGAIAGNLGTMELFRDRFSRWVGDYTLNIANQFAAAQARDLGLFQTTLSVELTIPQIRDIIRTLPESEIIVYGTLPSMNLRYCPMREANEGRCRDDCMFGQKLIDRKQEAFWMVPFTFSKGDCLIQVLNAHCLDGLKYFEELRRVNAAAWRLAFYQETPDEVRERIQAYRDAFSGKTLRPIANASGGHFGRGVV